MQPSQLIAKKRRGEEHSPEELAELIQAYQDGNFKDYQMSAWLMAVCFRGMTVPEMAEWTRLMWKSGTTFPRPHREDYWVDKHSTGGVGDKPSLILVPVVTAAAERVLGKGKVKLPMVSGRALGHTGGTLDKLESVRGFSPKITIPDAMKLLEKNGFFMMGQTQEIAPVDRRLYALRDVTATVESIPLIVSSIMSKKLSENLNGIVLDVKTGRGAFMKTEEEARALAKALVAVAKDQKIDAYALLTSMDEPLGRKVGNLLEIEECWEFLQGNQETGLKELVLETAARMLFLAGRQKLSLETCREECLKDLGSVRAQQLFRILFEVQGGVWANFESDCERLRRGCRLASVKAETSGWLASCDALEVGLLLNQLGGGRRSAEDTIDPFVGFEFHKKVGESVKQGENLVTVYCREPEQEVQASQVLSRVMRISPEKPPSVPWIREIIQ